MEIERIKLEQNRKKSSSRKNSPKSCSLRNNRLKSAGMSRERLNLPMYKS